MSSYIDRKDFYKYGQPELEARTRKRLTQLHDVGIEIVGIAEFGIPGKCSGMYIERVWNDTESEWTGEIKWLNEMKKKP